MSVIKNIFLDTNIYEENNFFHSNDIQGLFYYSRIGEVNLYMTSISKNELIERMRKRLEEAKNEHNQFVASLNKPKSRILKNLQQYEELSKSQIKVSNSLSELTGKLNRIIQNSKINIIECNNVNVDEIFHLYYSESPPFSKRKEKKHEFPDAFIIKSLDEWCITNKKRMIVVTKDFDFNGYKSTHIFFWKELSSLLQKITLVYDAKQKNQTIPKIKKSLEANSISILTLIEADLFKYITLDIDYENVTDFIQSSPVIKEFKIITIRPDFAEVTCNIELDYSFTIFPTPLELEKAIFEENIKPKKFRGTLPIPCDLEVDMKNPNKIRLKRINQNERVRITI